MLFARGWDAHSRKYTNPTFKIYQTVRLVCIQERLKMFLLKHSTVESVCTMKNELSQDSMVANSDVISDYLHPVANSHFKH